MAFLREWCCSRRRSSQGGHGYFTFDWAKASSRAAGLRSPSAPITSTRWPRAPDHIFRQTAQHPARRSWLTARQIACGNVACASMRHLAGEAFSDSAWCAARETIAADALITAGTASTGRRCAFRELSLGESHQLARPHRVAVIDDSSDSMPDTPPLRKHYGVSSALPHRAGLSHLPLAAADGSRQRVVHRLHRQPAKHLRPLTDTETTRICPRRRAAGGYRVRRMGRISPVNTGKAARGGAAHYRRIVDFTPDRTHAHPRKGKSTSRGGGPRSRVIKVLGKGRSTRRVCFQAGECQPAWMSDAQWEALHQSITLHWSDASSNATAFGRLS